MYKVFIVDDEELALEDMRHHIAWIENGFELTGQSQCPWEAVDVILRQRPDVVFTDIKMPEMDGTQLIQSLREKGLEAQFVVVSALDDFSMVRRILQLQGFDYLLKPVTEYGYQELFSRLSDRLRAQNPVPAPEPDKTTSQELNAILEYLQENLEKKHSLTGVSKRFSISANYICSLFSKNLDTTFVGYIVKLRMERAARLLHDTDKAVKEIAVLCGYDDYFYFCKVFRSFYGCTPTQLRRVGEEA